MSLTSYLLSFLESHYLASYFILFIGSYAETLIITSFFIYGEIFFLVGAILAGAGYLNIWLVSISCILGGLLGDTSSFIIGKKYGFRLIKRFFKDENKYFSIKNYNKVKSLFHKSGKKTIFFARFMGPISWITPFIAGTLNIKYKDFIKYNFPGAIGGIGIFLVVGYMFGFSYQTVLPKVQRDLFYIMFIVVVVSLSIIITRTKIGDNIWGFIKSHFVYNKLRK